MGTKINLSACVTLLGRFEIPSRDLGIALIDAEAVGIMGTKTTLGDCITLIGRFEIPAHCLGIALLDTEA